MRALVYNPGNLVLLRGPQQRLVELEPVGAAALLSAAEQLSSDAQLPILLATEKASDVMELLRSLRQSGFSGPLLILLAKADTTEISSLLNAGADDAISLPADGGELQARISAVGRRLRGVTAEKVSLGALEFYLDGRHPLLSGKEMRLSSREYAIMRHLMLNGDKVVAKDSIYDSLYALCAVPPFDKIIDVYICRLRAKMSKALPGAGAYIETVPGRGYRIAVNNLN